MRPWAVGRVAYDAGWRNSAGDRHGPLATGTVNKRFGPKLQEACKFQGVNLLICNGRKDYLKSYREASHVITWGMRVPKEWYAKQGTNTLYIENAIPAQRGAVWLDDRGWFNYSAMCKERHFDADASPEEVAELQRIAKRHFGWNLFQGGNPNGPIMYAVQKSNDMPALYCFPNKIKGRDNIDSGLSLLSQFCPDRPVAVRPHPRCPGEWARGRNQYMKHFHKDWTLDRSKNVYQALLGCSALVTVNSTLAVEAAMLGIRVATLGESVYTGSNAWLECGRDPTKLAKLFEYEMDEKRTLRMLAACVRHRSEYDAAPDKILQNLSFRRWISKIPGCKPLPPLLNGDTDTEDTGDIDVVIVKYFRAKDEAAKYEKLKAVLEATPNLIVHEWDNTEDNIGLSKARNKVLLECEAPVVCFMDFDLELYNMDWQLMRERVMHPGVGIVTPVSIGSSSIHGGEWEEKEYLSCNCMMFRRQFLEEIDNFDEDYFVFFADWDVIKKTMNAGKKIYQHNHSTLRHLGWSRRRKKENQKMRDNDKAAYDSKWDADLNRKKI